MAQTGADIDLASIPVTFRSVMTVAPRTHTRTIAIFVPALAAGVRKAGRQRTDGGSASVAR
jgi:hypothetical protein